MTEPPTHFCVFDVDGKALCVPKPVPWQAIKLALEPPYQHGEILWPKTWAQALDQGWKLCGLVPGIVVDQENICAHYAGNTDGPGVCNVCEMAP